MPIVMSKDEWARIQKWTDACKEDPMAIKRREQLKLMNERSKEMTKDWPNSLENVNKRNEEARRARVEATEQANKAFYRDYVKRKQEDQERRLYEARDTIFKNTDAPKLLLSAVIETAILKERDAQVEFNKQLRARMYKHEHRGDAEIFRKAKEFDQLQEDRKQRRLEADKKNQLEIIEQIKEAEEKARRERELELKMEILDNEKAEEEIEALKEFEEKLRAADRARIFADMEQANRDLEARRLEVIARDKMDDRLIEVLNKSKARIESRRRKIEKEIKEERFRVLEGIRGQLKSGDAARDALEQSILEKTLKEQHENAKARLEAENAKRSRLVAERKAAHADYLQREQARLKELEVRRQWEMMNRFKNQELYEVFKQKENMEKEKRLSEYRKELNNLMMDRAAREAAERAATRDYHGGAAPRALRDADARVLRHARHLLREAEREGRNAWPIHRALQQYCRIHRLSPTSTPDEESPRPPAPRPETPPGGAGVCCETAQLQRKLAAEQLAKAKPPPEEGGSRLPEVPAYHQHGPAFPTLLHPDTDCFDEKCETGACHCEHLK